MPISDVTDRCHLSLRRTLKPSVVNATLTTETFTRSDLQIPLIAHLVPCSASFGPSGTPLQLPGGHGLCPGFSYGTVVNRWVTKPP